MNFQILEKFALSSHLSDFSLILPQELGASQIPCHKIILAANSDFFNKLFENEKQISTYTLPFPINSISSPITEKIFQIVVKFGYKKQTIEELTAEGLNENNSFNFFSVAKVLNFFTAENLITKFIEERNFVEENFLSCLLESIKFDQGNWVHFLIKKIAKGFNEYVKNEEIRQLLIKLPFEHIQALLGRDDLFVENEDLIFELVLDYLKFRENLPSKEEKNQTENQKIEENLQNKLQKENQEKKLEELNKEQKIEKQEEKIEVPKNLNEKAELLLKNYKLNLQEKVKILSLVRLSYVSHKQLMDSVREEIISPFKDLILEAISAKLSTYEKSQQPQYSINTEPRECYTKKPENNILANLNKQYQQKEEIEEDKKEIKNNTENIYEELTPKKNNNQLSPQKQVIQNQSQIYESMKSNFLDTSDKKKNEKKINFIYSYDLDENGALYWLGSEGRRKQYKNPYTTGQVKVFFSSISENSRFEYFVGRSLENCRTSNQEESYMGVDFGKERTLYPKQYSIRNRDSMKHIMLNWIFEASLDYNKWFLLDKRIHFSGDETQNALRKKERNQLMQKGAITTWAVDLKKLKTSIQEITLDIKNFRGFRYFRIKQMGKNSSESFNLALSGFELYGTGFGNWCFEENNQLLQMYEQKLDKFLGLRKSVKKRGRFSLTDSSFLGNDFKKNQRKSCVNQKTQNFMGKNDFIKNWKNSQITNQQIFCTGCKISMKKVESNFLSSARGKKMVFNSQDFKMFMKKKKDLKETKNQGNLMSLLNFFSGNLANQNSLFQNQQKLTLKNPLKNLQKMQKNSTTQKMSNFFTFMKKQQKKESSFNTQKIIKANQNFLQRKLQDQTESQKFSTFYTNIFKRFQIFQFLIFYLIRFSF